MAAAPQSYTTTRKIIVLDQESGRDLNRVEKVDHYRKNINMGSLTFARTVCYFHRLASSVTSKTNELKTIVRRVAQG